MVRLSNRTSKILKVILLEVAVSNVQSFPTLQLPVKKTLPIRIETKGGNTGLDAELFPTNVTDSPAALSMSSALTERFSTSSIEEPTHPVKLDYYDYLQLPNNPDDELPALPGHGVNVNEDYAGIYDYRGSQDGRFRRKRTLTTNVEQLLTRSSRIRSKRGARQNEPDAGLTILPAEQAENLVTLLSVMQDTDPDFDAAKFLKVLDAPSVSEQDLEYILFLSNLAPQKDSMLRKEPKPLFARHWQQPSGRYRIHHPKKPVKQTFYFAPDSALADETSIETPTIMDDDLESENTSRKKDLSRLFEMASFLAERGPAAGTAM